MTKCIYIQHLDEEFLGQKARRWPRPQMLTLVIVAKDGLVHVRSSQGMFVPLLASEARQLADSLNGAAEQAELQAEERPEAER